jgi:signal transduction histidine kinase
VPGTGLGLYLARELARLHKGEIVAVSKPGEGSEFVLSLPVESTGK